MVKHRQFDSMILTCEHGGLKIPPLLATHFRGKKRLLKTHRGWDIGALMVAKKMSLALGVPLEYSTTSRLVVDLNRTVGHKNFFSEITRNLSKDDRKWIVKEFYRPYRLRVESMIEDLLKHHRSVLHLSIHSFTPKLDGKVRTAEIGVLFDPKRRSELDFANGLMGHLQELAPKWRTKANYPYLGISDGFQPYLRKKFSQSRYAGLEIEMNQALTSRPYGREKLSKVLLQALAKQLG